MNAIASVARDCLPDNEDIRAKQLIASIVQRAVMDWVQYKLTERPERKALYDEANGWLFGEDRVIFDAYGITFPAACQILEINLTWFREALPRLSPAALLSLSPEALEEVVADVLDE